MEGVEGPALCADEVGAGEEEGGFARAGGVYRGDAGEGEFGGEADGAEGVGGWVVGEGGGGEEGVFEEHEGADGGVGC